MAVCFLLTLVFSRFILFLGFLCGLKLWLFEEEEEEAIVNGEEKMGSFVGGNSVDEAAVAGAIDDGQTVKEAVTDETNGLTDDGLVGSREDGVKEVSQIGAGEEIAGLTGGDEVHVKSVVPENVKSETDNVESNGLTDDGLVGSQEVGVKEVSEIGAGGEKAVLTDADEVDLKPDGLAGSQEVGVEEVWYQSLFFGVVGLRKWARLLTCQIHWGPGDTSIGFLGSDLFWILG